MTTKEIKTQIKKTLSSRPAHWATMYPGDKTLYVTGDLGFSADCSAYAVSAVDRLQGRVAEILMRGGTAVVVDDETGAEYCMPGVYKTRRSAIAALRVIVKNEFRPEFEFYKTPGGRVVRL